MNKKKKARTIPDRIISRKSGNISRLAFPAFLCILGCIGTILHQIRYPEVLNVRVELSEWQRSGGYLYLTADIPQPEAGRIRSGQPVQLWLDGYPYPKFGAIKGRIRDVAGNEGKMQLLLPQGMTARGSAIIPFRKGQRGDLVIETQEMRLGERIFHGAGGGGRH